MRRSRKDKHNRSWILSSSSRERRSVSADINLSAKWNEKEKEQEQILAGGLCLNHHKTGLMFTKVVTVATEQPSGARGAHTNPSDIETRRSVISEQEKI